MTNQGDFATAYYSSYTSRLYHGRPDCAGLVDVNFHGRRNSTPRGAAHGQGQPLRGKVGSRKAAGKQPCLRPGCW